MSHIPNVSQIKRNGINEKKGTTYDPYTMFTAFYVGQMGFVIIGEIYLLLACAEEEYNKACSTIIVFM